MNRSRRSRTGETFFSHSWNLDQVRLAQIYEKLDDTARARHWYERFTEDWKDADPDITELIEARERLGEMRADEAAVQ